jgi:hypothetical protein
VFGVSPGLGLLANFSLQAATKRVHLIRGQVPLPFCNQAHTSSAPPVETTRQDVKMLPSALQRGCTTTVRTRQKKTPPLPCGTSPMNFAACETGWIAFDSQSRSVGHNRGLCSMIALFSFKVWVAHHEQSRVKTVSIFQRATTLDCQHHPHHIVTPDDSNQKQSPLAASAS